MKYILQTLSDSGNLPVFSQWFGDFFSAHAQKWQFRSFRSKIWPAIRSSDLDFFS